MRAVLPGVAIALWFAGKQFWVLHSLGLRAGPWFGLSNIACSILLATLLRVADGRMQGLLLATVDGLLSLLFFADALAFRAYSDLPSISRLHELSQLGDVLGAARVMLRGEDWLWAVNGLGDLLLFAAAWKGRLPRARAPWWETGAGAAFGAAVLLAVCLGTGEISNKKWDGAVGPFRRLSPAAYHVYDVVSYVARHAFVAPATAAEVKNLKSFFHARAGDGAPQGPLFASAAGLNVIIIQVESLQAYPLGLKVHDVEVTPHLNALARESLFFDEFYGGTGIGTTADADLLVNCSMHPLRQEVVYTAYGDDEFHCIPTILREHGYRPFAFKGGRPDFWNLRAVYRKLGFERYFSLNDMHRDEIMGLGLSDASFLRQAARRLSTLPQPFSAFLITMSSHVPFAGIGDELGLGPEDDQALAGRYLNAIHYADGAIGAFIEDLRARGILDRSLVIIYGDHAPQGMDRDPTVAHIAGYVPGEDARWLQFERHLPLLIHFPRGAHAGVDHRVMSQVDVGPTLLRLLGITEVQPLAFGRDALGVGGRRYALLPDGSALDADHIFVSPDSAEEPHGCFARATGLQEPATDCSELATTASSTLAESRAIIERNLMGALEAGTAGQGASPHTSAQ